MAKKPLKPDRPIASIAFPKSGRPRLEVERLPRTQRELELSIGGKFLGALGHFRCERYADLRPGSEPADLVCKRKDGSDVAIQVVEIVDHNIRLVQTMRRSYAAAMEAEYQPVLAAFRGCSVTLVDPGAPPYLPLVRTAGGRASLQQLVSGLTVIGADIGSLGLRKIRTTRLSIGPDGTDIHVLCERFAVAGTDIPFSFRWSGGAYRIDEPRALLSGAVEQKIRKGYARPSSAFWLLAYSTDTLLMEDDPDVLRAEQVLAAGGHVFDAVWFLYPYNDLELGHLVRVWPADETRDAVQLLHPTDGAERRG